VLDRGNTLDALSAASELKAVALSDALELLLLLARKDPSPSAASAARALAQLLQERRFGRRPRR
jgi:hypothetical protein